MWCSTGPPATASKRWCVEQARLRGERFDLDKARLLALELVEQARQLVATVEARAGHCTPRVAAFTLMAEAEESRLHASDADLWERAAARWEAAREPYPAAYCRWREGEALLDRRAGRSRATDVVQRAWRVAVELGTAPLRARIEQLAQRARIALDPMDDVVEETGSSIADDLGLTQREVEVLAQLAAGRTNREIGDQLYISTKTVSVHVSNVLRKLEVTNRVQAARIGQAHGLSTPRGWRRGAGVEDNGG